MPDPNTLSAYTQVVGVLVAIAAVAIALWQSKNLVSTLKINGLMALLQLESQMNDCKQKVEEKTTALNLHCLGNPNEVEVLRILRDELNGYIENWLNSADRLAYCILNEYLAERNWASEYRTYFSDLVKSFEDKFGPSSIYTNIIDLNHKWQRK